MKKTEIITTTYKINAVRVGDIFQFTKSAGCRVEGEMLVLLEDSSDASASHIACLSKHGRQSNFTSLQHLTQEMNEGNLIYLGNIDGKEE